MFFRLSKLGLCSLESQPVTADRIVVGWLVGWPGKVCGTSRFVDYGDDDDNDNNCSSNTQKNV